MVTRIRQNEINLSLESCGTMDKLLTSPSFSLFNCIMKIFYLAKGIALFLISHFHPSPKLKGFCFSTRDVNWENLLASLSSLSLAPPHGREGD